MRIKGALKFLVLKVVFDGEVQGSVILNIIEKEIGWRASPGTFYPLMQELVNLNFVKMKKTSNATFYSITIKGKKFLKKIREKRKEIILKINESIKFLKIFGEEDMAKFIEKNLQKDCLKFFILSDRLVRLDEILNEIDIKNNHEKINNILEETNKKLEKLR
ncbi:MAG: PadR family transcriptional regulator [Candidatus Pacearchaeota archaeon]|nr:PadR family transcriptional regulator [Candidatus Pacearchaeota archaeon]